MAIKDLIAIPIEEKKTGDGYWMAADSGGARRWGPPPW